ncbi:MAG: hypothetical protein NXI20_14855 [bacterium]|nr:hypothetical protein [bacterium]
MVYALSILLFLHGLIHVLGFAKAYWSKNVPQLKSEIPKPEGIVWLTVAIVMVVSGVFFILQLNYLIWLAVAGVVFSQILIFKSWEDAKYGTIANIIVALQITYLYMI